MRWCARSIRSRREVRAERRRPFALKDRPVIASPESTKHPGVGRVELARQARQRFVPRNAQLPFHQLLGFGKIVDPGKTVIVATIAHAVPVHHPGQPLPSVEADWDGKREPGLDAGTPPTELIINPVGISKQALAQTILQLQFFLVLMAI